MLDETVSLNSKGWHVRDMGGMSISKVPFKIGERKASNFGLYGFVYGKDPLSYATLHVQNEKHGKENLGHNRIENNTKVEFGITKDHG